jgi:hypothetical protein
MQLDQPLRNAQTQAQAVLAGARFARVRERLEEVGEGRGLDAASGVRDDDVRIAVVNGEPDADVPILRRELDGIAQQAAKYLAQPKRVAAHGDAVFLGSERHADPLEASQRAALRHHLGQHSSEIDRRRLQHGLVSLDACVIAQVVDDAHQVLNGALHVRDRELASPIIVRLPLDHLQPTLDRAQRRGEIVRDLGQDPVLVQRAALGGLARLLLAFQEVADATGMRLTLEDPCLQPIGRSVASRILVFLHARAAHQPPNAQAVVLRHALRDDRHPGRLFGARLHAHVGVKHDVAHQRDQVANARAIGSRDQRGERPARQEARAGVEQRAGLAIDVRDHPVRVGDEIGDRRAIVERVVRAVLARERLCGSGRFA